MTSYKARIPSVGARGTLWCENRGESGRVARSCCWRTADSLRWLPAPYGIGLRKCRAPIGFGNDLAVRNGDDSWTLPMPGRFVVDRTGIIRAADVDPDYQYRPEPQKTVGDVKALG